MGLCRESVQGVQHISSEVETLVAGEIESLELYWLTIGMQHLLALEVDNIFRYSNELHCHPEARQRTDCEKTLSQELIMSFQHPQPCCFDGVHRSQDQDP